MRRKNNAQIALKETVILYPAQKQRSQVSPPIKICLIGGDTVPEISGECGSIGEMCCAVSGPTSAY